MATSDSSWTVLPQQWTVLPQWTHSSVAPATSWLRLFTEPVVELVDDLDDVATSVSAGSTNVSEWLVPGDIKPNDIDDDDIKPNDIDDDDEADSDYSSLVTMQPVMSPQPDRRLMTNSDSMMMPPRARQNLWCAQRRWKSSLNLMPRAMDIINNNVAGAQEPSRSPQEHHPVDSTLAIRNAASRPAPQSRDQQPGDDDDDDDAANPARTVHNHINHHHQTQVVMNNIFVVQSHTIHQPHQSSDPGQPNPGDDDDDVVDDGANHEQPPDAGGDAEGAPAAVYRNGYWALPVEEAHVTFQKWLQVRIAVESWCPATVVHDVCVQDGDYQGRATGSVIKSVGLTTFRPNKGTRTKAIRKMRSRLWIQGIPLDFMGGDDNEDFQTYLSRLSQLFHF